MTHSLVYTISIRSPAHPHLQVFNVIGVVHGAGVVDVVGVFFVVGVIDVVGVANVVGVVNVVGVSDVVGVFDVVGVSDVVGVVDVFGVSDAVGVVDVVGVFNVLGVVDRSQPTHVTHTLVYTLSICEPLNLDARAHTRTALVQRTQLALAAAKFDKSETRAIAEAALKTWTVAASAAAEADYVAAALDRLRADTDSTPAGALASLVDVADSAAANARELAESASRGIEAALWRDGVEFASLGRADQAQRKVVAAGNLHVPRALFAAVLNESLEGLGGGGARRTNGRFNRWRDRDDSGHNDRDRYGDRDHDRDRGHADRGRDRVRGGGDDGRGSRRGIDRDGPDRGSGSGISGGSGNSSGGGSAGGGSGDRAAART